MEEAGHVRHPAQGEDTRCAGQRAAQPPVAAAQDDRQEAVVRQEPDGGVQVRADAPGTGGEHHGGPPGAEPLEQVPPLGRPRHLGRAGGELGRHDGSARPGRCAGAPPHRACRVLGEAQAQVVAGVEPLPVHLEVDHQDDGGHPQQPALPQVARELGPQVEDGHDDVRARPLGQFAQSAPGQPGQRCPAGAAPAAGPQEEAVQGGVRPGEVPDRPAVEAPEGRTQAVRQEREDVDDLGGVAALARPAGQFDGDRVVAGAHARADHQQTSAVPGTAPGAAVAGLRGAAWVHSGPGCRGGTFQTPRRRPPNHCTCGRFGRPAGDTP